MERLLLTQSARQQVEARLLYVLEAVSSSPVDHIPSSIYEFEISAVAGGGDGPGKLVTKLLNSSIA
jgi:hypothetical protein